ncbi:MAG: AraC family transcriptional regulator [Verrucomicrobiota bacterium]|nr:AraC family transcriptional regulator [Verrucomicrobiota bacterium]
MLNRPDTIQRGTTALFGSLHKDVVRVESIDVPLQKAICWERNSCPDTLEIWMNLSGEFVFQSPQKKWHISPGKLLLSVAGHQETALHILGGSRNKIIRWQLKGSFVCESLPAESGHLHPVAKALLQTEVPDEVLAKSSVLMPGLRDFAEHIGTPPIMAAARSLWFAGKARELMAHTLFLPLGNEFFCTRQKRVNCERVSSVKKILRASLSEPPSLQQIAQKVGCSPFYLSRTFSTETGMTIPQYLRDIRIEKAAELLRTGACNVTEAAFEVGYNSPSHFSQAFCQIMGVCPAMYPRGKR